jgi:hypothetical protein
MPMPTLIARRLKLSTRLLPHSRTVRMSAGLIAALGSMPGGWYSQPCTGLTCSGHLGRRLYKHKLIPPLTAGLGFWPLSSIRVSRNRNPHGSSAERRPPTVLEDAARRLQHGVWLAAAALLHHLQQPPLHARLAAVVRPQAPGVFCANAPGRALHVSHPQPCFVCTITLPLTRTLGQHCTAAALSANPLL